MNDSSHHTIKLFLVLLLVLILFHLGIITKMIPYDLTWGGRLNNDNEMYLFEGISILVNLFLAVIVLTKGKLIHYRFSEKVIDAILWVFLPVFALNTVANLFAVSIFEKSFSLLSGVFVLLLWKILMQKRAINHTTKDL